MIEKGEKAKANFGDPATPLDDRPPRESVGLNFKPQSLPMSFKTHLNIFQKVRVPRNPRRRPSRIFRNKPESSRASLAAETVTAEPADVGNLLSRHIISVQCRGRVSNRIPIESSTLSLTCLQPMSIPGTNIISFPASATSRVKY